MRLIFIASLALFGVVKISNAQEVEEAAAHDYHSNFPVYRPHNHAKDAPPPVYQPPSPVYQPRKPAKDYHGPHSHRPVYHPHKPVQGVRATFTTPISGAEGTVTITDSTDISAKIEITDLAKISEVKSWPTCSRGGLIWSIQEFWPDISAFERFGEECLDSQAEGAVFRGGVSGDLDLGGRYDPTFACSSLSQYAETVCDDIPNFALTLDTEYLEDNDFELFTADKDPCSKPVADEYNCWPCLYQQYRLACEVGDLSGKYGNLQPHNTCPSAAAAQAGEVEGAEAAEQAAVVDEAAAYHHCTTGPHVHFKTHDRFMPKPSVFRARALRLSCNDGTPGGTPLMCAKLLPFVESGKDY